MKTLNLTTSELLMLRVAVRNERDNTIDEKMQTNVYNDELIEYYDGVIDKYNDLINRIEDLI